MVVLWSIYCAVFVIKIEHPIRLNVEFRRDLQRWLSSFQDWNGVSFFYCILNYVTFAWLRYFLGCLLLGSDGSVAHTASFLISSWFFLLRCQSIAFLDLVPIVVATHYCTPRFACVLSFYVTIRQSSNPEFVESWSLHTIMHLLRSLTLMACRHNFVFFALTSRLALCACCWSTCLQYFQFYSTFSSISLSRSGCWCCFTTWLSQSPSFRPFLHCRCPWRPWSHPWSYSAGRVIAWHLASIARNKYGTTTGY